MKKASQTGLQQTVYNKLATSIQKGQYQPGQKISGRGLAKEMDASLTPVRESLLRLEALGAIQASPTGVLSIPDRTLAEVEQLYAARILVEGQAAAEATALMTDKQLDTLIDVEAKSNKAFENFDLAKISEYNEEFHMTLYGFANNKTLMDMINMLWLQCGPLLPSVYAFGKVIAEHVPAETAKNDIHMVIIEKLKKRDSEGVRKAMSEDIRNGLLAYKAIAVDLKKAVADLISSME